MLTSCDASSALMNDIFPDMVSFLSPQFSTSFLILSSFSSVFNFIDASSFATKCTPNALTEPVAHFRFLSGRSIFVFLLNVPIQRTSVSNLLIFRPDILPKLSSVSRLS